NHDWQIQLVALRQFGRLLKLPCLHRLRRQASGMMCERPPEAAQQKSTQSPLAGRKHPNTHMLPEFERNWKRSMISPPRALASGAMQLSIVDSASRACRNKLRRSNHVLKLVPLAAFLARYHDVTKNEDIHLGAQETIERLIRRTDDRLVFVKRGVKDHRNAGEFSECFDEAIVAGIGRAADHLQSPRAVDMGY